MEKRFELSLLLDFYGPLLTEKQKNVMDLYFNEDLSLKEISEITKTSRQAIHDIIKRCENLLVEYEEKLNLLEKSIKSESIKQKIIKELKNVKIDSEKNSILIDDIIKNIIEI
ncbi:putative DNA-binding protein [Clostridium senegalense]|uniref:putative DNA-binding protein n=1 Tax=Clostridium senegalense TaxID=1465809 RepID=UPI001C11EDA1|nr:putative DNA-binding protein [Clostridium senegalense]MBU5225568.1 putative DNA-binding protein [Clostridium senegalense]